MESKRMEYLTMQTTAFKLQADAVIQDSDWHMAALVLSFQLNKGWA